MLSAMTLMFSLCARAVVADGDAQFVDQVDARARGFLHERREIIETISALLLGHIHGLIGVFQQGFSIGAILGVQRDADAARTASRRQHCAAR